MTALRYDYFKKIHIFVGGHKKQETVTDMKLVILDAYTANPGDISWDAIKALTDAQGNRLNVEIYERTTPEEMLSRATDAELLLTNKVQLTDEIMSRLPCLKYIGVLATGYNVVDIQAASQRGIIVTNIPAYSTASVAQMAMAHLLNITQMVALHSEQVKEGKWQNNSDFCFWETPLIELQGQTMGIVGLGNTGMATARIAQSMGMKVMAWTRKTTEELATINISKADTLEQLFSQADVLSLHCPLTPDTHHLVNANRLSLMKPTAILINTGRGPLINEQDLADALNQGRIYAAGLDVLEQEPPRNGSPLIGARNCHITPHIAWATQQARKRLIQIAAENLQAFIMGKPMNCVNI